MSFYLKISSYLVGLYFALKLRTYLPNKLNPNKSNDQTVDQQIVLFFPETQIRFRDYLLVNYH